MSDQRTPHWLIQLRFFLLCSPVGIGLAIILAPFALPVLVSFGVITLVFWNVTRLVTNGVVSVLDPDTFEAMQEQGCDPFHNCLSAPLNFDSDQVRIHGFEPNANCPNCDQPVFVESNVPFRCPTCDAHFHENNWWVWDGTQWLCFT